MQRYFSKIKNENEFILADDDIRHITRVMRMKDQDEIIVVFENNPYLCCLEDVNQNISIKIKKELEKKDFGIPEIVLVVPLLKEQKMDLILQKATELGVNQIIPYLAEHSIIKLKDDNSTKKLERWNKIVKEASEQSHRDCIPLISDVKKFNEIKNLEGLNLICSTREKNKNIKNVFTSNKNCAKINLVIGPEGGLSKKEENELIESHFIPVTLGNRIMRVETVPLFIMSIVNYEFME